METVRAYWNADWALVGANAVVKMQVSGRGPRWAAPQVPINENFDITNVWLKN
jgi:hypothetical protein